MRQEFWYLDPEDCHYVTVDEKAAIFTIKYLKSKEITITNEGTLLRVIGPADAFTMHNREKLCRYARGIMRYLNAQNPPSF